MKRLRTLVSTIAVAALGLLPACSWSRFDDLESNSPVATLGRPKAAANGWGASLATASKDGHAMLFVGGAASVAPGTVYDLGTAEAPDLQAIDVNCDVETDCRLSPAPAALGTAHSPGQDIDFCFVLGIGKVGTASGISVRCSSGLEYTLAVPPEIDGALVVPELAGPPNPLTPHSIVFGTDSQTAPALVAGASEAKLAWYYASLSGTPMPIPAPTTVPDGYGARVAALAVSGVEIFAVAAPAAGEVWLYRSQVGASVETVGCLSGSAEFGRAMASGPIAAGGGDSLLVADASNVYVYDGAALAQLAPTTAATCADAATSTPPLATLGCSETRGVTGCADSDFGAALSVGDLDGDGDGEAVVGAPRMRAGGKNHAGALFVFDMEPAHLGDVADVKYLSSAGTDDLLGSALATPVLTERSIIAASAPGGIKVGLFYCSDLLLSPSSRCP